MKILLALAMLLMIGGSKSKQAFEGCITYKINIVDDDPTNNNELPKEVTSYHKEGKMRIDVPIDGVTLTLISNVNTDEVAFMVNTEGMKLALKTNKSNLTKEVQDEVSNTQIQHLGYHKNIAGIKCHKAIISNDDEESTMYIADKLNAEGFAWLFNKQLDGTLMEFRKTGDEDNSEIHIYATKVSPQTIEDKHFELPPDHIMISISDIGSLFDGGIFN